MTTENLQQDNTDSQRNINNAGSDQWQRDSILSRRSPWITRLMFLLDPKRLFFYINLPNKKIKILDFGSGNGLFDIELGACKPHASFTGVEISDKAHGRAREFLDECEIPNVGFDLYDGGKLPYKDASFDIVISCDVFGHVPDLPGAMGEISRVLKPGGRIVIFSESKLAYLPVVSNLTARGFVTDPFEEFHISIFSRKDLAIMLQKKGFDKIKMYSPYFWRFFTYPEWYYPLLRESNFRAAKLASSFCYHFKKILGPIGKIVANLLSIAGLFTTGRFVETGGVFILGRKEANETPPGGFGAE